LRELTIGIKNERNRSGRLQLPLSPLWDYNQNKFSFHV
jgi:hypothetical protein